jgi:transposase-like protein
MLKLNDKDLRLTRLNPKSDKSHYPVEKKIEAVTHYLALGNMRQVSAITGISYSNLRLWKTQDWWNELEAEIKASRRSAVNTKLSKIIDRSLELVQDRVDNGDIRVTKEGDIARVPLSALTATKVAADLMQRQDALEKLQQNEVVVQNQQSIQDTLSHLAQQFASFNKARTVDVITKDVTDALYEEREEGLQEGERTLQLQAGECEEEDGEELCEGLDDESGEGT